jgi:PAS domain S-box-containing protein
LALSGNIAAPDDHGTGVGGVRDNREMFREGEAPILELISAGAPLSQILYAITNTIDEASVRSMSSVLLVDADRKQLRHGGASKLPASYCSVIDGLPIAEGSGVCGTAAHRIEPVYVSDVATDPLCKDFVDIAKTYGFRSCWSTPVLDSHGKVIATLALYGSTPGAPEPSDVELMSRAAHLVSISVERDRDEALLRANEALLRMALHVSRMGAWSVELPGQAPTWSDELRDILEVPVDYSPSVEASFSLYLPEHVPAVARAYQECASAGTAYDLEVEMISGKGRRLWARLMGEAERDSHGAIVRVQGALQDITERKEAELRAHHMEERLARTLESISEAFITMDREWRFTYLNLEAEQLLQRSRSDLVGKVVWDEYPQAGGPAFERAYRTAVATGTPVEFEEYYPGLDCWFRVRAFPTPDGLAVYFNDVTLNRRATDVLAASEERFRLLSKATSDAIWDWDLVSGVVWWNEGIETLFGYPKEEVEPTPEFWTAHIHPDDVDEVVHSIHEAIDGTVQQWSAEYRYRHKSGTYLYVIDRGYLMRDSTGKAVRMIGGMTDLSERKEAELRLAEQAALLDQAGDAILVRNMDNQILYWNRSAEVIYGWSAAEVVGKSVADLLYTDPAPLLEATATVLRDEEWSGELEHLTKCGKLITVGCRWTLLRNERGEPKSILGINSDITEKKRLEQQFLRAQRMESIGTLASGIAHDLNNILAPILMSTEMLKADVQSEEALQTLETLSNSAKRGAELIKQVLGFARGIDGKPSNVNAGVIARDIQQVIRDTFPRNIDFHLNMCAELWGIHIDPTQLHQVLINLCVNARDAMPNGGVLRISLENVVLDEVFAGMNLHSKPGPFVLVCVSDTGAGMSPEVQEKIFEPFFTTKELGKGTGLGLSTTFTIVKNHGGVIHLYSEPDKGTTIKIYLPALTEKGGAEDISVAEARLPLGHGELILVVDDEEGIRETAQKALERFGYRVITAVNGAEGVSTYVQNKDQIAVVLTDMSMPVMDGPAMIVALKSIDPSVRIIGSSGLAANGDVAKALGAGVDFFVPKPYTADALLATLKQVLDSGDGEPVQSEPPKQQGARKEVAALPKPAAEVGTHSARILLVEDEDLLRELAMRMVATSGYVVVGASNGREALRLLAQEGEKFDLVITDINMPLLDGEGLYHESVERYPDLPFVFMSGSCAVPTSIYKKLKERTLTLPKPYSVAQLREAIQRALGR